MTATVIVAHPNKDSFNHAIFSRVRSALEARGARVFAHDLYEEKFNPLLTVRELGTDKPDDPAVIRYGQELLESDYLFFIHPNWWGQPPAILKGFFDRVIRQPDFYEFPPGDSGGGIPTGKLKAKWGIVFNTSNTNVKREAEYFGDPLERIWKQCIFAFCGIEKTYRRTFSIIAGSTQAQRDKWLQETATTVDFVLSGRLDEIEF